MRHSLTALALLAALPVAEAADNGVYLGAGVGQANIQVDGDINVPEFDEDDTGFKVIAGFRPVDWFAAELNYIDLGKPSTTVAGTRVETQADGIAAYAVGFVPLPLLDLYGKIGVIDWDAKGSIPQFGVSTSDSGTDLAYGVGLQVRFWSLGARLEYEKFEIGDTDDTSFLSLSFVYTFL